MPHLRLLVLAALFPVIVLASPPATAASGAPSGGSITGTWATTTDGVRQVVTFARDGRLSGDSGCNRLISSYTAQGAALDIAPIASTLMYCEGRMEAERTFVRALEKSTSFSRDGRRLTLYGTAGRTTLELRRR